ncbi:MAG TPA: small ribosomal subunit Rsm22 family protein [Nitrospira sp.]
MRSLNATVSPLLLDAITQLVQEKGLSHERLTQTVTELSRLFTKGRAELSRPYLEDPTSAAAYLNYFLPVNLSKIQALLDELPGETFVGKEARFSVLDLGAGPGTAGVAVLDWLHHGGRTLAEHLSVTAVDISGIALRQAERLWNLYARTAGITSPRLQTYQGNLRHMHSGSLGEEIGRAGPFDLIVLANCLNEMWSESSDPTAARAGLITTALSWLSPHGTLMIVEPALRETSRALHQVRDQLLAEKRCTVFSPCLHEGNCPALINPDDWCHEERPWEPPTSIMQIDREVGFIKDALKFSYLLLRTDGRTITDRGPHTFRVVSELRKLKGDTRAWLCNELGRSEVGRLNRALSSSNSAWDDCQRGTIVRIEGVKRKDGAALGRIPAPGKVEIIKSV